MADTVSESETQGEQLRLVVDIGDAPLLHEYVTQMYDLAILNQYALGRVFQAAELSSTDRVDHDAVLQYLNNPPVRVLRSTLSSPWSILLQHAGSDAPIVWLAAGTVTLRATVGLLLRFKRENSELSMAREEHGVTMEERRAELVHRTSMNTLDTLERYDRRVANAFGLDPERIVGTDTLAVSADAAREAISGFGEIQEVEITGPELGSPDRGDSDPYSREPQATTPTMPEPEILEPGGEFREPDFSLPEWRQPGWDEPEIGDDR